MAFDLTAEKLRALFEYHPDSGIFRKRRGRSAGRVIGKLNEKGHRRILVAGKLYYAGRLAFLYVYGRWPNGVIDHRNGDPDDNRIANLREAESWENSANKRNGRMNRAGLRGVHQQRSGGWQAQISHRGKRYALGTFKTKEEAHAAYVGASCVLRGEFSPLIPDLLPPNPGPQSLPPFKKEPITIDDLRRLLAYDPETGIFRWLVTRGRRAIAGTVAGTPHESGHVNIVVMGTQIGAHRLAWAFTHNEWPDRRWVDHINGIRNDNRIANLRLATPKENARNSRGWGRRSGPLKGAYFSHTAKTNPWRSWITVEGKRIYLGTHATAEEAHAAYMRAAREHFGEFASGG